MVLREGLVPVVAGLVAGITAALLAGGTFRHQLYGIAPHDPTLLVAVAATLLVVGIAACAGPARRALGVDPAAALRSE